MKKKALLVIACCVALCLAACDGKEMMDGESAAQSEIEASASSAKEPQIAPPEEKQEKMTPEEKIAVDEITEEEALNAITRYCFLQNPALSDMISGEDTTFFWTVSTNEAKEIVVLFRSYTGALIRYYVDPKTGDTYVTEYVPGITEEEQRTDETLNVRDYLNTLPVITGA